MANGRKNRQVLIDGSRSWMLEDSDAIANFDFDHSDRVVGNLETTPKERDNDVRDSHLRATAGPGSRAGRAGCARPAR
jgi:hypothetical protein